MAQRRHFISPASLLPHLPAFTNQRVNRIWSAACLLSSLSYLGSVALELGQRAPTVPDLVFGLRALVVAALASWIALRMPWRNAEPIAQHHSQIVAIVSSALVTLIGLTIWLLPDLYAAPGPVLLWYGLAFAMLSQIWWLAQRGYTRLSAGMLLLGGIMHVLGGTSGLPGDLMGAFVYVVVILIAGLLIRWWAGLAVAGMLPLAAVLIQAGSGLDWQALARAIVLLEGIAVLAALYARSLTAALGIVESHATELKVTQGALQAVIADQEARIGAATAVLAQREAYFRSLVQNSSDITTLVTRDGLIREQTPAIQPILGFAPGELVGQPLENWLHPDDAYQAAGFLASLCVQPSHSQAIEWRLRHRDGSWRVAESVGINMLHDSNVQAIVLNTRDISERRALEERLVYQAFHDPLSGLPNRALFTDRVAHALARTQRSGESLAVLCFDLDRFKIVNDSLGHQLGDKLLAAMAERVLTCIRPGDTAARIGGDEFAVLLENLGDTGVALRVGERILSAVSHPLVIDGHELCVTTSIGVALSTPETHEPADLLRQADAAMYQAKHQGKAQIACFAPHMYERASAQLATERDLRRAIERDELHLAYQPIVVLGDGRTVGFEALLRWQHPERGMISPAEFIPLAEETGLIVPIGQWVLGTACADAAAWLARTQVSDDFFVSINLSARQIAHAGLVAEVAATLASSGLAPQHLNLEITEQAVVEDVAAAQATLRALKQLGLRIAVDDFGIEHSSLGYIKRFPIDIIKLDRAFVSELSQDSADAAIVRAMVTLAETLRVKLVVEGIETAAQATLLHELGCRWGQGYHLGRPKIAALSASS